MCHKHNIKLLPNSSNIDIVSFKWNVNYLVAILFGFGDKEPYL